MPNLGKTPNGIHFDVRSGHGYADPFFDGMGNVSARLLQTPPKDLGIPSIVVYELEVGIGKSDSPEKRRQQLATFSSTVKILPFELKEALSAAQINVDLEKLGSRSAHTTFLLLRPRSPMGLRSSVTIRRNSGESSNLKL